MFIRGEVLDPRRKRVEEKRDRERTIEGTVLS